MSEENKNEHDVSSEGRPLDRQKVHTQEGELVMCGKAIYRIERVLDFESVFGIDLESGRGALLRMGELRPVVPGEATPAPDLAEIVDEDWRIAQHRFGAIRPLVDRLQIGRGEVEQRAKECGVSAPTLYRWLRRYRAQGCVTSLIPMKRGWKTGNNKLPAFADRVVEEVIRDFYLSPQRPSAQKAAVEVERRCRLQGIDPPSPRTVRRRIEKIPERERLRARGFKEKVRNKFRPAAGSFPNADFPLAVVQIDHTPADIILVDDVHRKAVGRPWITLAIDVYSRMVTGYYLSFDPPSETSVGMCVAHSILPKDEDLLTQKVEAEWPVWGFPRTIHVDNGPDFRSDGFKRSCAEHGIHLEFRPVKQPRYGGHIERMLGTLLREVHQLPGTTFSSVKERSEYNAEKHAAMTLTEFEEWLVRHICGVYHRRIHSEIGLPPLRKWEIGILGDKGVPGIGVPARPSDPRSLWLDFLPSFERTVQAFGVTIDGLTYYADSLRPWINAEDPKTKGKRSFFFRRDPRDISAIWFRDPDIGEYFKIPFADLSRPAMSLWEYRQAREELRKEGIKSANEHQIFRVLTELREKVEKSQEKTKKARRQAQRRREHERKVSPAASGGPSARPVVEPMPEETLTDEDVDFSGEIA